MSFWLTVLIIAHIIQGYFWLWVYNRNLSGRNINTSSELNLPGVSVVIAAKDEAGNLAKHLPAILSQEYPNYEVLIVDDHSIDNSSSILTAFAKEYPHLMLVAVNENHGKKNALSLGITKAKYPWILCTDADCIPKTNQWISGMLRQHASADMILGYGPYEQKPTLLSAFINYETWYIAIQYFSAALLKRAYMGVGRNLCFRKSLWEEVGGYEPHKELRSGDDDLFVNAVSNKRIRIETDPKSWTYSIPQSSFKNLWKQKRRHLTTATVYSAKNQFLLSLNFLSVCLLYLLSLGFCYLGFYYVLLGLGFRWFYLYLISHRWMKKLDVLRLWPAVPFWDLALVIYYSVHGLFMWHQKKGW